MNLSDLWTRDYPRFMAESKWISFLEEPTCILGFISTNEIPMKMNSQKQLHTQENLDNNLLKQLTTEADLHGL